MSFVVGEAGAAGAVATAAPSDSTAHTILLLQITSTIESRTYLEFEHPMQAVEGATEFMRTAAKIQLLGANHLQLRICTRSLTD